MFKKPAPAPTPLKLPSLFLNQHYPLLAGVLFILILCAGYFLILSPQLSALRIAKNTRLPAIKNSLQILNQYFKASAEMADFLAQYHLQHQVDLEKLDYILPTEPKQPELIAQLDALAAKNSFSIKSLSIAGVELKKTGRLAQEPAAVDAFSLKQLEITMSISGADYLSFKQFLRDLEDHLRLLDLYSVAFKSALNDPDYSLNLRTYFLPALTFKPGQSANP